MVYGSQCVRMPPNNNPVTNVNSNDIRCNVGGTKGVGAKCAVKAGSTVTVEMHAVRFHGHELDCRHSLIAQLAT